MRRAAPTGDDQREVTDDRIRREPLPSARAILWTPLPDSYHLLASMMRATGDQAHLFVTQRAFLQVERHLRSAPDLELGGFLAGQLYECPRTHMRYSIVNTVVSFADVTGDPIGSRVTQESFEKVRQRLDAHGLFLIGWYRNGAGLGLQLLPDDVETHLTYFDRPWQTTMLVVPDPAKSRGAFFTYDQRVGRSYCIPFYELFDAHAAEANRLDRTCVTWTTYVAGAPVRPLAGADKEIVEATVAPMRSAPPEPEPPEPIDEWWDAIKDPWVRLKDVAARPTRRDAPMPLVFDSALKSRSIPTPVEPPRRPNGPVEVRRPPEEREVSLHPAAPAQQKEAPRPDPNRPAPPFAGPARPVAQPAGRAEPVARAAAPQPSSESQRPRLSEVQPPRPATASRPQAQAQSRRSPPPKSRPIPPATAEALLKAATSPVVALPPDFHDDARRWERRRRVGFVVAGLSFVAAIGLSTVRSRSETMAQAATSVPRAATNVTPSEATSEGSIAPVVLSSENGHAPVSLASVVDSLSGALAYYRDIADNHREGLVGCRVLDRAYALVGRARVRVDSTRRRVNGQLSDADSIRVSMLGAEYTHVTQTYQRSGCRA
jgi:hypothetical protein